MNAIVYVIFMCSSGIPHCTQANNAVYPSASECLLGAQRQYRGTMRTNGRIYVKVLGNGAWLRCFGVSPYDGTVVERHVRP
jgi:hypothetical protein